jgi:hypothetical protein
MPCLLPLRRRRLLTTLLLACALASSNCQAYHVYQIGGPRQREQGNQPSTEWKHKTLHSFLWGAVRQDLPIDNCQTADGTRFGIEEVKIEAGFRYVLGSAVTLGLWVPLKVGYRCAKPPVAAGSLR